MTGVQYLGKPGKTYIQFAVISTDIEPSKEIAQRCIGVAFVQFLMKITVTLSPL